MPCVECSDTMEFSKEMKEVKEFLVSDTYPEHLGNDKGKTKKLEKVSVFRHPRQLSEICPKAEQERFNW